MSAGPRIRRALLSVYDKTGIVEFARALHDEFGVAIISTGGTARTLRDAGIPVTLVEDITGFPEMLDGRVKTLHPKIHAAILADRDNPEHLRQLEEQGIEPIDLVVVNLYPFEKTIADPNCKFEDALEMIDIGGPCLLRAAAKNHKHVVVIAAPERYGAVLAWLRSDSLAAHRCELAAAVFERTLVYDYAIQAYLERVESAAGAPRPALRDFLASCLRAGATLRYGENPHQLARCYTAVTPSESARFRFVAGEPMSFNNHTDATAAYELCAELTRTGERLWHRLKTGATRQEDHRLETGATASCCFIKHTNACGVGVSAPTPIGDCGGVGAAAAEPALAARVEAYRRAYLGDPNAAMGGILACNFDITPDFAAAVLETYVRFGKALREGGAPFAPGGFFVEVWVAPAFSKAALAVIRGESEPTAEVPNPPKKDWGRRVRLLEVGDMSAPPDQDALDYKPIAGGMLVQTRDRLGLNEDKWKVVTDRQPTERELADLRLAWLICKHTKSNAVSICKDGMLLGNGAGQMSRVMSCRIATWLAKENGHADKLAGAAAASDGFFPFRDGPDVLADAGVTAMIQPGGSKRDAEVITACNERSVAMICTGTRHFKH